MRLLRLLRFGERNLKVPLHLVLIVLFVLLTVGTVPEADFMEQIDIYTRTTVLLCVGALLGSIFWSVIAVETDITACKQAEEALRQSEARFQKLAASAPGIIYSLVSRPDNSFYFEYVSSAAEKIHEVKIEQIREDIATVFNQIHPDDQAAYREVIARSVNNLEPFKHEFRIITPSGKMKWLQAGSQPERRENKEVVWHGVALDVSEQKQAEAALRESEATKNQILKAIPDLIIWMTVDGICLDMIEGSNISTIVPKQKAIGNNLFELMPPEVAEKRKIATQRALQTGEVQVYEQQLEFAGKIHYEEVRVVSVGAEKVLTIIRDITARKQAELELEAQQAFLRQVIDGIPSPVFVKDLQGRLLVVNNAMAAIYGVPVEQMLGKRETDFACDFQLAPVEPQLLSIKSPHQNWVQHLQQQNGERRWFHTLLSPFVDASGQIQGVIGNALDVTDLKQAETALQQQNQALRESEERFRSAFHNAPIGMALISLNARCLKINSILCDMLGYTDVELLAQNVFTVVDAQDSSQLKFCVKQALSTENRSTQVKLRLRCNQGRIVWALVNLSVVRDAYTQPLYYVAQIQDITQQQAIDQMKHEFISVISHELRTPLTAIRGCLGLLETGIYDNRPDKAKRMLELALTNSERLVLLVNDILDLERLDSGKVQLTMTICQAAELMQRAVEGVQAIADTAGVTLCLVPTTLQVWAAPDSIIQTLTNLLSNAIKFSKPQTAVTLAAESQVQCVRFQVKDQGRGIPPDKLEIIFGRFQQVDASDSRQKGGTGLGLAICRSIVEQHGGRIWAESVLGEGSTFYFTLPFPPQEDV